MKYKIIDPKGLFVDGVHHATGSEVVIGEGAALNGFIHFKQVEEVAEKPSKAEKPDDGKK